MHNSGSMDGQRWYNLKNIFIKSLNNLNKIKANGGTDTN